MSYTNYSLISPYDNDKKLFYTVISPFMQNVYFFQVFPSAKGTCEVALWVNKTFYYANLHLLS